MLNIQPVAPQIDIVPPTLTMLAHSQLQTFEPSYINWFNTPSSPCSLFGFRFLSDQPLSLIPLPRSPASVSLSLRTKMAKVYTFEEVVKHNNKNDCWIIVFGKVYDVTQFLHEHPGGDEVLVSATEKDATDEFEFVGHSNTAKNMMSKYYIGDIDRPAVPVKHVQNPTQLQNQSSGVAMKIFQFLVPLLILGLALGLALGLRHYGKNG
ncbi:hypothetical protein F2P56_026864 [Juglans regia]|uniref:Cytochrome b5-like isoform X2 n=2 Tax=Juglans regia TaxID=51240 RepID=A0A2I4GSB5_JUGRE|nr:cytochrome b5-like isoform X2 [Juglans regia]KAF5451793.1 hypothetical protein F2P56_026864 [Juglans regia]